MRAAAKAAKERFRVSQEVEDWQVPEMERQLQSGEDGGLLEWRAALVARPKLSLASPGPSAHLHAS